MVAWLRFGLVLLALGIALAAGCGAGRTGTAAGERIPVVATTGMVADLVRNIGGERVAVTALMGPGVDPHLFKPTEGDVARLQQARIIFYNGLHLEGRMGDILVKMAREKPTVAVAERIPEERLLITEDGWRTRTSGSTCPSGWRRRRSCGTPRGTGSGRAEHLRAERPGIPG